MSATLGTRLVDAAVFGYLGGVFTRDAFFAPAVYLAFWVLIYAPTYYPIVAPGLPDNVLATYFYLPAIVFLGTIIGLLVAKLLDIGQLVDVWLTGSGGGENARHENLNVPFLVFGLGLIWLAVFFFVANMAGGSFIYGAISIDPTVAIILGVVAVVLAISAFVVSAVQHKFGTRFVGARHDYISVWYLIALTAAVIIPWFIRTPSVPTTGNVVLTTLVIVFLDFVVLGVGTYLEYRRDRDLDPTNVAPSSRHGRFYAIEGSRTKLVLRFVLVILLHTLVYIFGAWFQNITADDVAAMFGFPNYALFFLIAYGVLILMYVPLITCCKWPKYARMHRKEVANEPAEARLPVTQSRPAPLTAQEYGGDPLAHLLEESRPRRRRAMHTETSSSKASITYEF